jgi:hypothetical protein
MKKLPRFCIATCLALLALGTFLGGCATGTGELTSTSSTKYAPTDPAAIKIYQTQLPTAPYDEIGRVSVDKYNIVGIGSTNEQMMTELRRKAADMGGDAIVSITQDFASMSGVVVKFTTGSQK